MAVFSTEFCVRYEDVDVHNNLTPAGFVKYLLDAGSLHSDSCGYGFNDIPKTHVTWIVLNWKVKMYRIPHCSDVLKINTWSRGAHKSLCYRDYEIFDDKNNLIAIATSRWVLIDYDTKNILTVPPYVVDAYGTVDRKVFGTEISRLKQPDSEFTNRFDYTILRRDIDTNNHVNNSNYLLFACEALPDDVYNNMQFKNIEVMYRKQCLLGDKISCLYNFEGGKHYITIKSSDLKILHAIIVFS